MQAHNAIDFPWHLKRGTADDLAGRLGLRRPNAEMASMPKRDLILAHRLAGCNC
jgi:hypothetical protein